MKRSILHPRAWISVFIIAVLAVAAAALQSHAAAADSIEVRARTVGLVPGQPDIRRVGDLIYLGGLDLSSPDERFGGYSGMAISPDGSGLLAVSDRGSWLRASLAYENDRLKGLSDATIVPLLDAGGKALRGHWRDAEAIAAPLAGQEAPLLVSFERRHRIWAYAPEALGNPARPVEDLPGLTEADFNGGLEALTYLPDGGLLAITEYTRKTDGHVIGWHRRPDGTDRDVSLILPDEWGLTDLAVLPDGDLLALERWYKPINDLRIRLRRLPASGLETPGVPLDGPVIAEFAGGYLMDNMEAMDVRQTADGTVMIYLLSDDNFNPLQRTLLMMFALAPRSG